MKQHEQPSTQSSLFELPAQNETLPTATPVTEIARTARRAMQLDSLDDKIARAVDQGVGSYADVRRRYGGDDGTDAPRRPQPHRPVQYRSPHYRPSKVRGHDSDLDPHWNVEPPRQLTPEERAKRQETYARGAALAREALRNRHQ